MLDGRAAARCRALNDRDLHRYGMKLSPAAPPSPPMVKVVKGKGVVMVTEGIDPGFAYSPGEAGLAGLVATDFFFVNSGTYPVVVVNAAVTYREASARSS